MAVLGGIERLLTAKGWERAAIVYAFTRVGGQGAYQQNVKTDILTTVEFARLGIHGLRSHNTVRIHHENWKAAIAMLLVDNTTTPARGEPAGVVCARYGP